MSVAIFCRNLPGLSFGKDDRKWFPKWIWRYASDLQRGENDSLSVSESEVIHFLQSLRGNGVPAWQRLQATRAVEAYRQHVLKTNQPCLIAIKQTLQRVAAQERNQLSVNSHDQRTSDLVGNLPADEPKLLTRLRTELRRCGYKYDTERAYVGWIKRFIKHCHSPQLDRFGEAEIKDFLTALAVEDDVALSTQKQAKCALLFLYQKVLGRELGFLDTTRVTKPERLPVVLSRAEIQWLLPEFLGRNRLMFWCTVGTQGCEHDDDLSACDESPRDCRQESRGCS